jgi:hypothetical protein
MQSWEIMFFKDCNPKISCFSRITILKYQLLAVSLKKVAVPSFGETRELPGGKKQISVD